MIELENVSYTYPHTVQKALHDLSLSLPEGKCILVTGPSGAGKTTLCLAAAGILHHEYGGKKEGFVSVEGKNVSEYTGLSAIAQKIGIVFDDAEAQMIFTTVEEEILSALEHRGLEVSVIEDRLATIMEVTHLSELRNRSPHKLSGGQKQRVALAATLALGNDILILDEPTSELDEHATGRIVSILKNLRAQGKTILLIEHKFSHFREIVDTLVVMENGKISAIGAPSDLFTDDRLRKIIIPDFSGIRTLKSLHDPSPRVNLVTSDPLITVQNLSYFYGEIQAINSLDLSINRGEFVAIVGENGSGKTTLVKHFNGLLIPTRGNVIVAGKDTRQCTITDLAREVGLVFQNPDHMFFADTVRQEVEFGLKNIGIPDGDLVIDKALADVGLSHTKDLYPRWLSRGERQRLAIACVIAMRPPAIVLDNFAIRERPAVVGEILAATLHFVVELCAADRGFDLGAVSDDGCVGEEPGPVGVTAQQLGEGDAPAFILEEVSQRLDQLELHPQWQTAHVVVALDGLAGALDAAGFDDVGVERALDKPVHSSRFFGDARGFVVEDGNELGADDLPLLLRFDDACKFCEEALACVDGYDLEAELVAQILLNVLKFVFAQDAVVDEDAGELVANGLVYQRRRHR